MFPRVHGNADERPNQLAIDDCYKPKLPVKKGCVRDYQQNSILCEPDGGAQHKLRPSS